MVDHKSRDSVLRKVQAAVAEHGQREGEQTHEQLFFSYFSLALILGDHAFNLQKVRVDISEGKMPNPVMMTFNTVMT